MFLRLVAESFVRQRRRKLLAGAAILLGTTAVTAMLALATTVGDRIHRELAVYGANIVITPKADTLEVKVGDQVLKPATGGAVLHESDLKKLRTVFWANNITGVSPELDLAAAVAKDDASSPSAPSPSGISTAVAGLWFNHVLAAAGSPGLVTGAEQLHPLWHLQGAYPAAVHQAAVGSALAKKLGLRVGDKVDVIAASARTPGAMAQGNAAFIVSGIVTTGDALDGKILLPLEAAQQLANSPDAVSRVEVSARTKPEDAFARRDPDTLSGKQRDIWYCRPYANSIAFQIREAIPGAQAEQVRQVEQSEGTILERISGLMWLVSAAALLAAGVAVSAAMATAVLERRAEIGLMRSLGASRGRIASLFYAEAGLLAVAAGIVGYVLGSVLAALLTARIFGEAAGITVRSAVEHGFNPVLLPVVLGLAVLVVFAGSTASIRSALRMDPTAVLRAGA